jgi:hypothetical protein
VLYDGPDAGQFASVLARMIQTLPLGSTFVVEAGKGGKVLGGGFGTGGFAPEEPPAKPARRPRKP